MGKGAFQECDQVAAVEQFCKYAGAATAPADIPGTVRAAFEAAVGGRPGAAYVDVPSNVLMAQLAAAQAESLVTRLPVSGLQVGCNATSQHCMALSVSITVLWII